MSLANGHIPEKPPTLAELREERKLVRAQLNLARDRALLESYALWDDFGGNDLWDRLRPRSQDDYPGEWLPPAIPSDLRHGSHFPLWRTQPELDRYRQLSRARAAVNSFARGLLKNLTNNIIGKGYDYKVQVLGDNGKPAGDDQLTPDGQAYARKVQDVVDGFLKSNHWNCSIDPSDTTSLAATRERDVFRTVQVDGEAFIRFHRQDDGTVKVRQIDAAQVRDGSGYLARDGWSYGIQNEMEPFEDVETALKYAVFWPDVAATGGVTGQDMGTWQEIDAEEVLHLKGPDTPSNVKRGLGLFLFDLGAALDRAAKLQHNASVGAAVRAAIAETWQYDQATQTQISSMAQALAERTRTDPVTGRAEQIERIRAGTVRRGPTGASLVEPSADNTPAFLTAVQGDLQQACAGAGVASFVIGDVASGNYSNYESASFPPVQNASCEQEYYKAAYARAVWHAVMWAAECGVIPADVATRVVIAVEAPAVLHRNELEKAQEDQIGVTAGWKDRQTCAAERGLDWHQVEANNDEYTQKQQAMMPDPATGESGAKPKGPPDNPPGSKPPAPPGGKPVREALEARCGPRLARALRGAARELSLVGLRDERTGL